MSKSNEEIIPQWIINHLEKFGNCSCGRDFIKNVRKDNVIDMLKNIGYNCELRIIYENAKDRYRSRSKYPLNAYYILEVKTPIKIYFI